VWAGDLIIPGPAPADVPRPHARGLWHTVDTAINEYHCPKEMHGLWLHVEEEDEEEEDEEEARRAKGERIVSMRMRVRTGARMRIIRRKRL